MLELIHKYIPSSKQIDMSQSQLNYSAHDFPSDGIDGIVFRSATLETDEVLPSFSEGVGTVLRSITRSASCTY